MNALVPKQLRKKPRRPSECRVFTPDELKTYVQSNPEVLERTPTEELKEMKRKRRRAKKKSRVPYDGTQVRVLLPSGKAGQVIPQRIKKTRK